MPLQCRFYENLYPEKDDVVVVNITSIQAMGSYVELLEYKNIGGMILHSELSRRRIRSINKLVRVGRTTVVMRRPSFRETIITKNSRGVVYVWLCCIEITMLHQHTPSILDECDIDEHTREVLISNIRHRLMPQAMKIRADFEVSCFTFEGIDAVRRALRAGLELNSEELPIRINLIAPPLYVLTAQTMEWAEGLEHLNKILETIRTSIESQGGSFKIQQAPRLVSDTDEADLRRHMAELEEANREVSGDEDNDEEAEGDEDEDEDGEDVDGASDGDD
ncbi:eukaryotic translation initiation factor 2 alpha subunit [Opisthorchis viverrini]|uniref:Eukaryotic translation initiation factor 2 subunit 1 n=1 Tax=Opisthorchis viverrini TaxID=6198 RepID=A0A1S8WYC6_OPIVI|nr:eukaryotic translation initiation factor 2 alpha subunit [Opisthorchis viverrini]